MTAVLEAAAEIHPTEVAAVRVKRVSGSRQRAGSLTICGDRSDLSRMASRFGSQVRHTQPPLPVGPEAVVPDLPVVEDRYGGAGAAAAVIRAVVRKAGTVRDARQASNQHTARYRVDRSGGTAVGHVFVSYSRADFYYAESVTAVINQSGGVRAWLDAENLRPGTDWAGSIDSALDKADALLLMASPAALRSPYVRAEWTRALDAGIPVHVAVVRAVSLPVKLAHCPKHDLRTRFWSRSRRLARELTSEEHGSSDTVRRGPVLPLAVLLLMALLCVGIVMSAAAALLGWDVYATYAVSAERAGPTPSYIYYTRYARFFLVLMVCNAMVACGLIVVLMRLLVRRATPSLLRQGFSALLVIMGFNLVTLGLAQDTAIEEYYRDAVVVAVFGVALVSWSRTVHLWMPTGEGQHHIRQRILGRVLVRPRALKRDFAYQWRSYQPRFVALRDSLAGVGSAASYHIVHASADQPIAELIARACDTAGFARDDVDARWTFVVVSAHTDWKMAVCEQALLADRAVFVLASSLLPPQGIDADAELIRCNQWLDFRDQGPGALYEFLRSVVAVRQDALVPVTVPASMERFHGPIYLSHFLLTVQFVIILVVMGPLGLLVANSSPLSRALPITVVTALLITLLLRLAWRTATRLITAEQWRLRAWLIFGAGLGWSLLVPVTGLPPVVRIMVLVTLPMSLTSFGRAFRLQWLPLAVPTEGGNGGIAPVAPRLVSFSLVLLVVALTTGIVFIAPLPVAP